MDSSSRPSRDQTPPSVAATIFKARITIHHAVKTFRAMIPRVVVARQPEQLGMPSHNRLHEILSERHATRWLSDNICAVAAVVEFTPRDRCKNTGARLLNFEHLPQTVRVSQLNSFHCL